MGIFPVNPDAELRGDYSEGSGRDPTVSLDNTRNVLRFEHMFDYLREGGAAGSAMDLHQIPSGFHIATILLSPVAPPDRNQ
jgi:hypothetical protein